MGARREAALHKARYLETISRHLKANLGLNWLRKSGGRLAGLGFGFELNRAFQLQLPYNFNHECVCMCPIY